MEPPENTNLELSLLGEDRHKAWSYDGGNNGSGRREPTSVYMDSETVPAGLIVFASWVHRAYERLRIEVSFQGLDKEEPRYTLKVLEGETSLDAETIEEERDIHARNIVDKVDDKMRKFAAKEMIKRKLNPRRFKELLD